MVAEKKYWTEPTENILGTPEMEALQFKKLKLRLKNWYENSPFHKKFFNEHGINPDKIKTFNDFKSAFPPSSKEDGQLQFMTNYTETFKKTWALINGTPENEYILAAATSGTTGDPTTYLLTKHDLEMAYEGFARAAWRNGLRKGDIVLHAMALSMFIGGIPVVQSIQNYGCCAIPVGIETGRERVLFFAQVLEPKVLICTPSFAEYLVDKAPDQVKSLGLKAVLCGGEPGAGLPEVRKKIESGFGAKLYDIMGMVAGLLWASCGHEEYQGMHFLTDDLVYLELIDPETKKPISIEDGATGELLFTPLEGGLGFLRFSTGDVFKVETKPCPCGQTGLRYRVLGRGDDMLKVKGVLIYPAAIDNVIAYFIPRVTGEFRILLDEPPPRVKPPLKLKIERGVDTKEEELASLAKEIEEKMHRMIRVRPAIQWVPSMSLERSTHKTRFIERLYKKS